MPETYGTGRLREQLRPLRDRWYIVLVCAVITTAAAVAWSLTQPERYEASSRVLIAKDDLGGAVVGLDDRVTSDPERDAATDLELVTQPSLARRVVRRMKLDVDGETLLDDVTASAEGKSNLITISVRADRASEAARIANTYAEEYVAVRAEAERASIRSALVGIKARLERARSTNAPERVVRRLREQEEQVALLAALQSSDASVVNRAATPDDPVEPRPIAAGGLGLLLGLLLGGGLVTLRHRNDPRLRDVDDVLALVPGVPVLATVPLWNRDRPDRRYESEAFRALHTSLLLADPHRHMRSILVTSSVAGEGKSTTALKLAVAMAEHDESVLLVEADMRQRGLSQSLGLTPRSGLAEVLEGAGSMSSSIVEVSHNEGRTVPTGGGGVAAPPLSGVVRVLPAGQAHRSSHALLSGQRLQRALDEAQLLADRVVIDGTPAGIVSDALSIAARVDATIVVTRLSHTRRNELRRLMRELDKAQIRPLGVVVFGTRVDDSYDGYFGT